MAGQHRRPGHPGEGGGGLPQWGLPVLRGRAPLSGHHRGDSPTPAGLTAGSGPRVVLDGTLVAITDVLTLLNHPGHSSQKSHGRRGSFNERFGEAATGDEALFNVDLMMDSMPQGSETIGGHSDRNVYRSFQSYKREGPEGFEGINGELRDSNGNLDALSPAVRVHVDRMDAAFANSRTATDLAVYRGMDDPEAMFGSGYSRDRDMTGMSWTDQGYSSTTADRATTSTFTLDGGISARILVPEGHPAVTLSLSDRESEIVLPRGGTFTVVADHGWSVNDQGENVRLLDVEVGS